MRRRRLELFYQPRLSLRSGKIVAAEKFDSEAKPRKLNQSTLLDPEWFSRDS